MGLFKEQGYEIHDTKHITATSVEQNYDCRGMNVYLNNLGSVVVLIAAQPNKPESECWPLASKAGMGPLTGKFYYRTASGSSEVAVLEMKGV